MVVVFSSTMTHWWCMYGITVYSLQRFIIYMYSHDLSHDHLLVCRARPSCFYCALLISPKDRSNLRPLRQGVWSSPCHLTWENEGDERGDEWWEEMWNQMVRMSLCVGFQKIYYILVAFPHSLSMQTTTKLIGYITRSLYFLFFTKAISPNHGLHTFSGEQMSWLVVVSRIVLGLLHT